MRRNVSVLPLAILALLLATGLAGAQPLSNTLTSAQVACNETQLANLLNRLTLQGSGSDSRSTTLLVSYSNPYGFFEGLAVVNQTPFSVASAGNTTPESFLAFSLNPSIRILLANPSRQPLAQVSLVREDTSSNFVGAGSAGVINLFLNPTLAADATSGRLAINNVSASGNQCSQQLSADIKPGRGLVLAGLTAPCHTQFTDFDRTVFSILERTFRVSAPNNPSQDFKVAIFRGEAELTYRIDVYLVGANGATTGGKVALLLTLTADASGNLQAGSLEVLPACTSALQGGCTTAANTNLNFYLVPPVFGGSQVRLSTDVQTTLPLPANTTTATPATIDFGQILGGSTWGTL
jgi:hypothetical protein